MSAAMGLPPKTTHTENAIAFSDLARNSGNTDHTIEREEMVRYARFLLKCLTGEFATTTFVFKQRLTLWDKGELETLHDWVVSYMKYYTPFTVLNFAYLADGKCVSVTRGAGTRSSEKVALMKFMLVPQSPLDHDDVAGFKAEMEGLIRSGDNGPDSDDDCDGPFYFYYG